MSKLALLLQLVAAAAAAAAAPDADGAAASLALPSPARRMLQVEQSPAPRALGAFNGTVVPTPQGPLSKGDEVQLACLPLPGQFPPHPPNNWLNWILDVAINRPYCRKQQELAALGRLPSDP
ncbi:hypothetical protein Rsub_07724 [Raphidocelis subcapitata]|uniref:Ig-like domain-containing protein n=1 Tax=Raphidocelis subcapitata TaxID=307507 RepID=A0A2V0PB81_9CHLO|nr:hypothetical protein Rsub_07724 [Raphidocelis subcapitata]|eukprot:GBF95140.1 hypothetical protein Rsub_07724 [Raphidocelis subcapitata]